MRRLTVPEQLRDANREWPVRQPAQRDRQRGERCKRHDGDGLYAIHCALAAPSLTCDPYKTCAVDKARSSPPTSQAQPTSRLIDGGRSIQPKGKSGKSSSRRLPPPRRCRHRGSAAAPSANLRSSVTITAGAHAATASRCTRFRFSPPVATLAQFAPSSTPVASDPAKPVSSPSAPRA